MPHLKFVKYNMVTMIHRTKFFLSALLALSLLLMQIGGVFAAPILQSQLPVGGMIQSITLETDTATGVTLVSIVLIDSDQLQQTVRVSLETAIAQGFVVLNEDGTPEINNAVLGKPVEIDPADVIPVREETPHPVGNALATFFSDIAGMDYEMIMAAHEQGIGFGVIAQSLWLTTKLEGDAEIFEALLEAKQTGDFSAFILEDGSSPKNWGQLRIAILDQDPRNNVGIVVSSQDNTANGNGQNHNGNSSDNNGNGSENGNGQGNGENGSNNDNGNGQGNNGNSSDHGNGNGGGNGNGNDNGDGNGKGK